MGEDNIASRVLGKCMPNSKAHSVKSEGSIIDKLGFGKKSKAGKAGSDFLDKLGTNKKAKGKKPKAPKKKGKGKNNGSFTKSFEDYLGEKPKFDM